MARTRLAVIWRPTLGIPVVSRLALITLRALCVVLASLEGQSVGKLSPRRPRVPGWRGRIPGVGLTWQAPVSGSQTSEWPWQLQRSQVPR
jgi:hypothetical protein